MFPFVKKKEPAAGAKPMEEAKHRILGALGGKKREKSPSPFLGGSSQKSQTYQKIGTPSTRPTPPAKPVRLSSMPSEDSDNFHPLKTFNIPGLDLPVLKSAAAEERTLSFQRHSNGTYGFSLRRALAIDRFSDGTVSQRTVVLVDYGKEKCSMSNGAASLSTLMNGDQLLAVNDEPVEKLSREDIVAVIRRVEGEEIRLKVNQLTSNKERTVIFKRQSNGEFGFLLRRSQVVNVFSDGTEQRRTIVLAEPLQQRVNPALEVQSNGDTNWPRDQLVAINGNPVENLSREELTDLVNGQSGDAINLTVKQSPLLIPAQDENAAANGENASGGADESDLLTVCQQTPSAFANYGEKVSDNETGTIEDDRVWLVHRYGYAAGIMVKGQDRKQDGGKIRIRLADVPGNVGIDVDGVDVEKANPSNLDQSDDVANLVYLNESSLIHLLRNRFASNLIHTYAGSIAMLALKPQVTLSIYSEKVLQALKGCRRRDTPPHIYAVSQQTYRSMVANRRSQAVIFTGRGASGKTTQLKHFLHYLCRTAGTVNKILNEDKASSIFNILEAFGNCPTWNNPNASRFVTFFTLDFDHIGEISAGLLQCLILESNRVARGFTNSKEGNFHIFSYIWKGADKELKTELQLDSLEDVSNLLGRGGDTREHDVEYYRNKLARLSSSFDSIGVSEEERRGIYSILAAIFHLSMAGATKGIPSSKSTFLKPVFAQKAAQLLGVSLDDLQKAIFINTTGNQDHQESTAGHSHENVSGLGNRLGMTRNIRRVTPFKANALLNEKLSITDRPGDGAEALEAFIIGLYRETFSLVVSLMNRSLISNFRTVTSITLIDYPGYQCGLDTRAGFNEFCFNYVNERMQAYYHDSVFVQPREIYRQEKIDVDFQLPSMTPSALVELIDKPMQHHIVKSANIEARSQEKRGLLWLLDEESIFPGARDDSFIERIFVHYNESSYSKYLTKSRSHHNHFVVRHAFGTFPVTYNATGWLRLAQENPVTRQALPLLQESNKRNVSTIFLTLRSGGIPGGQAIANSTSSMDNASIRRTTAVFKTLATPQAMKRKSHCAMLKLQMDYLIENLRRCGRTVFVHCLDPVGRGTSDSGSKSTSNDRESGATSGNKNLLSIDVPSLRSQLRALQITDAVRFDKVGYPERMLFGEFRRRFECLSTTQIGHSKTKGDSKSKISLLLDDRESANRLLKDTFEADQSQAVLGVSHVFMKSNFLAQLEDKRDQELTAMVILFQAQCRAYLAKQWLQKRRVQDTAIRCVQKNINKYFVVRAWPWWRLYTRVLPLLNVQKTEEDLKAQEEELETLRSKCKKLEKQYSELKLHCDRLEARLEESRSEATDERTTVTQLSDTLEEENKMRIRAEKELAELKTAFATAEKELQKLELESMEYKKSKLQMVTSVENEENADENGAISNEELKEKLKEIRAQTEVEKKRYETEKKEESEHYRHAKQKLEKKLADLQKEIEKAHEQTASYRRLAEKSRDEAHDVRLHMQHLSSRNSDLEKRQRKFDLEIQSVKGETDVERAQKERLLKELQTATSECLRLEGELRNVKDEMGEYEQKLKLTEDDLRILKDAHGTPTKESEQQLRLQKQALERKCVDQEAELDDLSGELQQVQQRVTRLEMQNEKLRQENAKEAERREEEFDELRAQNQRRIRMMEEQIEDERHHKEMAQRKVKELEIRLREAEEAPLSARSNDAEVASLKRHLKKVKALLKDSQVLLEQYERNSANKGILKQLKNQLEDANALKVSAVKSKQNLESELDEIRSSLTTVEAAKTAAEDRCMQLLKEKTALENRLADLDQEVQDLLKKYKAQVQQSSVDHITLNDQIQRISDLERENDSLKDNVNELSSQLERKEASSIDKHKMHLVETKLRQLESKLELETAGRVRAEANCAKAKEQADSLKEQIENMQAGKEREVDAMKRLQSQYSNQQETLRTLQRREADLLQKQRDLEATVERLEGENTHSANELKVALRRVDDLQAALRDEIETEQLECDEEGDGEFDGYSSDEDDDALGGIVQLDGRGSVARVSRPPSSSSSTHVSC